jgi:hypothetical protein
MEIYGAGLAGLLAGCTFQTARLHEAGPPTVGHKALLRFRSLAVSNATGIEFKQVRVHKGIWYQGEFHQPSIQLSNWYSNKVLGRLLDRSIWNIEPVDRYVAPEDFISLLQSRCHGRITYHSPLTANILWRSKTASPIISTVPMNVMHEMVLGAQPRVETPEFHFAPITVRRWRLKGADLYQTIYFPDPRIRLYRVSITGDLVIAEYAAIIAQDNYEYDFWQAFGLDLSAAEPIESVVQRYGKIAPIDNAWRHQFMFRLSSQHKIFSLGRFGTWRNILLDDVIHDLSMIRKLMVSTPYESLKEMGKAI